MSGYLQTRKDLYNLLDFEPGGRLGYIMDRLLTKLPNDQKYFTACYKALVAVQSESPPRAFKLQGIHDANSEAVFVMHGDCPRTFVNLAKSDDEIWSEILFRMYSNSALTMNDIRKIRFK